ncbi:MAG: iron ABC transporter permease, partial [Rhodospirillaceae bacterium]|nr:iron ABC transporter permease [Rhodospirillaceae bacterium]
MITETAAVDMAPMAKMNSWSWINVWSIGTVLIAAAVVVPVVAVIFIGLTPSDDIWTHLASTVLPLYISTTLQLMIGVGVGTLIIGVGTAWLVS